MKTCHPDSIDGFLAGTLNAIEVAALESHIETCADCRRRLEETAGDEFLWNAARRFIPHECHRSGAFSADTSDRQSLVEDGFSWSPTCTSAMVLGLLAPSDDPAVAGRIGQYDVAGVIGRGSAGIVVRGFDRALHRNVAIKILDPALADMATARQRFAREARAMASISCVNVVPVYEVNEHAGIPYFVMEYMPGGSLERRLQEGGLFDAVAVVRIGMQVAQALAEAHGQGLVHRDIKPGNILLDRGTERARVSDFGLVRVVNEASHTRSGFITGTPQYMSPEQVRAEPCDAQADLFSLGAVMYTLCTGHPPFRAETVYGVMQRILNDAPRSIREQNPAIPAWLEAFILRLMDKERSERFAGAGEVAELLGRELAHLQDAGIESPPRPWLEQLQLTTVTAINSPSRLRTRRRLAVSAITVSPLLALTLAMLLPSLPGTGDLKQDEVTAQNAEYTAAAKEAEERLARLEASLREARFAQSAESSFSQQAQALEARIEHLKASLFESSQVVPKEE